MDLDYIEKILDYGYGRIGLEQNALRENYFFFKKFSVMTSKDYESYQPNEITKAILKLQGLKISFNRR